MRRVAARFAVGIGGVIYGFILAFACIYAVSLAPPHVSTGVASGCHEIGECPMSFRGGIVILLVVFGPAVVFATMNAIAWSRWPLRKWAVRSGLTTLLIVALYGILAI
jgi:hypothetical protein